jgi:hypothetical protein
VHTLKRAQANGSIVRDGLRAIRTMDPSQLSLPTSATLVRPRWYPTQLTLPDDRVIIAHGYASEWVLAWFHLCAIWLRSCMCWASQA